MWLREGELHLQVLDLGHFDLIKLLERLDTRLHLTSLGRLVTESFDEFLDLGHLASLIGRRCFGRPNALFSLYDELGEPADVLSRRLPSELDHTLGNGVDEIAIVRNEQQSPGPGRELLLEPQNRIDVEVVGWLVKYQDVRLRQQQPGEGRPHLPATGHLGQWSVHVRRGKAQTAENPPSLGLDLVATELLELALKDTVLLEDLLVSVAGRGGHVGLELTQLGLDAKDVVGAAKHLLNDRSLPHLREFLRQIADAAVFLLGYLTAVGGLDTNDDLENRRLSDTVAAHKRNTATVHQAKADVLE